MSITHINNMFFVRCKYSTLLNLEGARLPDRFVSRMAFRMLACWFQTYRNACCFLIDFRGGKSTALLVEGRFRLLTRQSILIRAACQSQTSLVGINMGTGPPHFSKRIIDLRI